MKRSNIVLMKTNNYKYPNSKCFRPSIKYPEYLFEELDEEKNEVYQLVRNGFYRLEYDKNNYGKDNWNPLGHLIKPGDVVVIKPNLVMDFNPLKDQGVECLYTQPSVVAAVVDYALIALKDEGTIIIGDAPMQECNFERLIMNSGYDRLIDFYKTKLLTTKIEISLVDFRDLKTNNINGVYHSDVSIHKGMVVELGTESEFSEESEDFFNNIRITNYDPSILKKHHSVDHNEYYVNKDILNADVIINMPKPKTHRKAGVTIAMKNLVGINSRKEYLPHHTVGSKEEGGDEYLENSKLKSGLDRILDKRNYYMQTTKEYKKVWLLNKITRIFYELIKRSKKDKFYEGSWYGNDTISRTIVDLNKILFYADKEGCIRDYKQRKYLIVADMIISGEKEGPIEPSSKNVGLIAMGENPVCFDEAILKLMGAKKEYISTIQHARNIIGNLSLVEEDEVPYLISNDLKWNDKTVEMLTKEDLLYYKPTSGWEVAFEKAPSL